MNNFIDSFSFDNRLAWYDVVGSIAHVKMLVKCRIIPAADGKKIVNGLQGMLADIEKGKTIPPQEDIHYAVEKELIKRIGAVGGKMHTARSRNDQVVTDLRLYTRAEIRIIQDLVKLLQANIVEQAKKNIDVVMPGYTHLQPAQPILFSHHILSYVWMFERDNERLADCLKRVNILPLGSAALAGTSFAIDRKYAAKLLSFSGVTDNSIDSVSDRDFVIEFLSVVSIISMHLSRLCEELVIWSSVEFNFIKIEEQFTSGSSIMPQKRNPDVAEIIRGKTGRVYGDLFAILTLMKGLPLAYNRDMQEDKPPLFDSIDTVKGCLEVMIPMIKSLQVNSEKMLNATQRGFLAATEIADYLAKKGMPFRQAHGIVKEIVKYCIEKSKLLTELNMDEFKSFSIMFKSDVLNIIKPVSIVETKKSEGGTSRKSVLTQIDKIVRSL